MEGPEIQYWVNPVTYLLSLCSIVGMTKKNSIYIFVFFYGGGGLPITEYKKCEAKLAAVLQEKKLKNVDFFYKPTLLRGFCTM